MWTRVAAREYWGAIRSTLPQEIQAQDLDLEKVEHRMALKAAADRRVYV